MDPRPPGPHAIVATKLAGRLVVSFGDAEEGPGGWVIIFEPELHLDDDILVPDIAGWKVERLPMSERQGPFFTIVPDWACEVLSPRTATRDREVKAPCYARHGVEHLWLVEPNHRPHRRVHAARRLGVVRHVVRRRCSHSAIRRDRTRPRGIVVIGRRPAAGLVIHQRKEGPVTVPLSKRLGPATVPLQRVALRTERR
jgi:hypothetical protein